jgi:hypothetical protein
MTLLLVEAATNFELLGIAANWNAYGGTAMVASLKL